jgi:hypothetical protein
LRSGSSRRGTVNKAYVELGCLAGGCAFLAVELHGRIRGGAASQEGKAEIGGWIVQPLLDGCRDIDNDVIVWFEADCRGGDHFAVTRLVVVVDASLVPGAGDKTQLDGTSTFDGVDVQDEVRFRDAGRGRSGR